MTSYGSGNNEKLFAAFSKENIIMRRLETVEEGHAHGQVRDVYRDVERLLGVPFVGAIFRVLATSPDVLVSAWNAIKPNLGTQQFRSMSRHLRQMGDDLSETIFDLVDLRLWMRDHSFDREDVRRILYVLEMFYHVDAKLLLVTGQLMASSGAMRNLHISRRPATVSSTQEPEFPSPVHRVMVEQASPEVREDYMDIVETFGMRLVPDDVQCLGNWPKFLKKTWREIKGPLHSDSFSEEAHVLAGRAIELAQELPYPVEFQADPSVMDIIERFHNLYAGMVISMSAIRRMAMEGLSASRVDGRAAGEWSE